VSLPRRSEDGRREILNFLKHLQVSRRIGLISARGGIRGFTRRVVSGWPVYFEIKRLILRAMAFTSRHCESALGSAMERHESGPGSMCSRYE